MAFANPLVALVRMALSVSSQFNVVEMVYFFFLPWTFGWWRYALRISPRVRARAIDRGAGNDARVLHPAVISLLAAGMAGVTSAS